MASEYRKQHAPQFAWRHLYNFELVTPQGGFGMDEDAIEGVLSTIASLQTALAAANERFEQQANELHVVGQMYLVSQLDLAAANARADKAEHDLCFFTDAMDETAGLAMAFGAYVSREQLEAQLQQATARAEALEKQVDDGLQSLQQVVIALDSGHDYTFTSQLAQRVYDLVRRAEAAERERDDLAKRSAGAAKGRLGWIWQQIHAREERWADSVNYSGGESMRTPEHAFFQAYDKLQADRDEAVGLLREFADADIYVLTNEEGEPTDLGQRWRAYLAFLALDKT